MTYKEYSSLMEKNNINIYIIIRYVEVLFCQVQVQHHVLVMNEVVLPPTKKTVVRDIDVEIVN